MGSSPHPEDVFKADNINDDLQVLEGLVSEEEVKVRFVNQKPVRAHGEAAEVEGGDPGFGFCSVQHGHGGCVEVKGQVVLGAVHRA